MSSDGEDFYYDDADDGFGQDDDIMDGKLHTVLCALLVVELRGRKLAHTAHGSLEHPRAGLKDHSPSLWEHELIRLCRHRLRV